jgi:AcrR family transcriptional regulator
MAVTTGAGATDSVAKPTARERLLAAADELFYEDGIQSVGIDRIIEHAGVAKASLYNTFGSKDELIGAYLHSRHVTNVDRITRTIERYDTPRERLLGIFDAQAELFQSPTFRGCAFARASAEARPGGTVVQATDAYRHWLRALFTDLAEAAGANDPAALAAQLQLLYDGALLSARVDRDPSAALAARSAAAALLDLSLNPSRAIAEPAPGLSEMPAASATSR